MKDYNKVMSGILLKMYGGFTAKVAFWELKDTSAVDVYSIPLNYSEITISGGNFGVTDTIESIVTNPNALLSLLSIEKINIKNSKVSGWKDNWDSYQKISSVEKECNELDISYGYIDITNKAIIASKVSMKFIGKDVKEYRPTDDVQEVASLYLKDFVFEEYDSTATGAITVLLEKVNVTNTSNGITVEMGGSSSSFVPIPEIGDKIATIPDNSTFVVHVNTKESNSVGIELTKDSVKELVNKKASLKLESKDLVMELDAEAVTALNEKIANGESGYLGLNFRILSAGQASEYLPEGTDLNNEDTFIMITNDAALHNLKGKAKVTIPYVKKTQNDLKFFYVNGDNGKKESISDFEYDSVKQTLTFTVDHMSVFGLSERVEPSNSSNMLLIVGAVAVIVVAAGAAFVFMKRRPA